jgi:hypothetical protein
MARGREIAALKNYPLAAGDFAKKSFPTGIFSGKHVQNFHLPAKDMEGLPWSHYRIYPMESPMPDQLSIPAPP